MNARRIALLSALLLPCALSLHAQDNAAGKELAELSLEELMNEPVTSVSRRETRLGDAPAAVAIISAEDIRRLGFTSIAEALRLVPGINVARVTANKWAITARGFNGEYASKLLVLIDGRSVYTPNFAGVYWDDLDLMLEHLERIEVIRGPGAAMWGANAVNGVINIITKDARDTQGWLFSGAAGTEDRPAAGIRYGSRWDNTLYYRVFARYFDRENFEDTAGQELADGWRSLRGGFRVDWRVRDSDEITVQGNLYTNDVGQYWTIALLDPPANIDLELMREHRGGNLRARWLRQYSPDSSSSLQIYYDRAQHIDTGSVEKRDTGDIDWQHGFKLGTRQHITWGLGYRVSADEILNTPYYITIPETRTTSLFSAFAQNEIALAGDRARLILGTKLEHNDYTGLEVQPDIKALWTIDAQRTLWASVARAVRTPARFDHDSRVNAFLLSVDDPTLLAFIGNGDIDSENVLAYEVGYRSQLTPALSADVTLFYNDYSDVLNYDEMEAFFEDDPPPGHVVVPLLAQNSGSGHAWGAELAMQWSPTERWRLGAGYSYLRMRIRPESVYVSGGDSPRNQGYLRSYLNITRDLELNGAAYYVDSLPRQDIDSYVRADLGVVWRPTASVELGLWGQNLLERRHGEFAGITTAIRAEVPRSVVGRVVWTFR